LLADVFDKEDTALNIGHVRRTGKGGENAEVATPQCAFDVDIGTLDGWDINDVDVVGRAADERIHGKDAGVSFTKFAVHHRACKAHHITFGQQGELDGAHVAEPEEQCAAFSHSGAE